PPSPAPPPRRAAAPSPPRPRGKKSRRCEGLRAPSPGTTFAPRCRARHGPPRSPFACRRDSCADVITLRAVDWDDAAIARELESIAPGADEIADVFSERLTEVSVAWRDGAPADPR